MIKIKFQDRETEYTVVGDAVKAIPIGSRWSAEYHAFITNQGDVYFVSGDAQTIKAVSVEVRRIVWCPPRTDRG